MEEKNTDIQVNQEENDVDELLSAGKKDNVQEVLESEAEANPLNNISDVLNKVNSDSELFKPLEDYSKDIPGDEAVSLLQKDFSQNLKKANIFSKVTSIILIAGVAGLLASVIAGVNWLIWTILGVVIVLMIVAFIFQRRANKDLSAQADKYISQAIETIDSYAFDQEGLTNKQFSVKSRVALDDLVEAHYFDVIQKFNSRNIVTATYLGETLKVGEVACMNPYQEAADDTQNTAQPVKKKGKVPEASYGIFGKYFSYPLLLSENASFILTLKGPNCYLPTYLDGYTEVTTDRLKSSFVCYTDNKAVFDNVLANDELVELLNSFNPDEHMENMFLSVNPHGLKICLNYNESVMEVPTVGSVKGQPYTHFKQDVRKVLDIIAQLKKD